ncbi:ATPase [bacterium]|nr:MAG: ATPase [bacterium]
MNTRPLTFLCVSFYFKGEEFLKSCKAEGNTVFLLTHRKLEHKPWPRESVDEFFYMDEDANTPQNIDNMVKGLAWLMREKKIDYIVALDDFDVEKAATFREEFRIPGMGLTTSRFFRDKLSMRVKAAEAGIKVPPFTSLFRNDDINHFCDTVPAPWVLKPRSEASAAGIKKVTSKDELWHHINNLGDRRHQFLVEQFKPGDVYHTDSLTFNNDVLFVWSSRYLSTPFEVAHGAGIFRSLTLDQTDKEAKELAKLNAKVMKAFGLKTSASHTEFIRSHDDGEFYFLETSSRVGGAHLAVLVEAASGINLWREWAKIETASAKNLTYTLPKVKNDFAGILISLARQEHPNQNVFSAPEVVWKMNETHHVGMVLQSDNQLRVLELLDEYASIVYKEFHASAPPQDKPTH